LYGSETSFQKVDQRKLESWSWRRTNCVKKEEVLYRVKRTRTSNMQQTNEDRLD
jgi:hypothetical protein